MRSQEINLLPADAKRAAEALEAVAQSLEGAAGDAAESLRDLAVQLRMNPRTRGNDTKPPTNDDDASDKK